MSLGEKYCVFSTEWGYFGISASDGKITRTCLPSSDPALVEHEIKLGRPDGVYDSRLLPEVQQQIRFYFEGKQCLLEQFALDVSGIGEFAQAVYSSLKQVCSGYTVSYGQLAVLAGRPGAARAIGRIMANNPYPLLVPCHRVVSASGKLGGFSGIGGVDMKKRLLIHEKAVF